MSVWSAVEPIVIDFEMDVPLYSIRKDGTIKPPDTIGIFSIPRAEVESRIRALFNEQNISISQVSKELGVSVTTVRRVCRTCHLGIYAKRMVSESPRLLSRSPQVPYGWNVAQGELIANPEEQKWISKMREMSEAGESLHAIARYLSQEGVPTKNGGKWYAKTVSQILRAALNEYWK